MTLISILHSGVICHLVLSCFDQYLQVSDGMVPQNKPWLLPIASFSVTLPLPHTAYCTLTYLVEITKTKITHKTAHCLQMVTFLNFGFTFYLNLAYIFAEQ
jgi:hypothetical protein